MLFTRILAERAFHMEILATRDTRKITQIFPKFSGFELFLLIISNYFTVIFLFPLLAGRISKVAQP